jgi:hypothetical protein
MGSPTLLGLLLVLLGYLPLVGGPGYEGALVAGLVAPGWTGVGAVLLLRRRVLREGALRRGELSALALGSGSAHAGAVLLAALVHALRLGACEPLRDFALLALGPMAGCLLAAFVAVTLALLVCPRLGRLGLRGALAAPTLVALGLAAPLASAAAGLGRVYCTATVQVFDPFVGHFAGPLYDMIDPDLARLGALRAATLLSVLGAAALLAALELRLGRGALRGRLPALRVASTSPLVVALGGLALALGLGLGLVQPGLVPTERVLAAALPGRASAPGCVVWYSPGVAARAGERVARECAAHRLQLSRALGLSKRLGPGSVRVLLFADAKEKQRLLGAGVTSVAKPWRRELYLQAGPYPHPVLGHELVHVLLAPIAGGPLGVPGALGGLVPDPLRVEGLAVALAPGEGAEPSVRELARVMLELGRLPSAADLTGLSFYGTSAARAYTASGAFVEYLLEVRGARDVRAWYGGAELERVTGRSLPELDTDFRVWLRARPAPPALVELARPRFTEPAVFERRCPHAAARRLAAASAACGIDTTLVARELHAALRLDPTRSEARTELPLCAARAGEPGRALSEASALLAAAGSSPASRRQLRAVAGDAAWQLGDDAGAAAHYGALLGEPLLGAELRSVALKAWALGEGGGARRVVQAGLLDAERAPARASAELGAAVAAPELAPAVRAAAAYLLGLRLLEEAPERALELLDLAARGPLPLPEHRAEAQARAVVAACLAGQPERARALLSALEQGAALERARRERLGRLVERCSALPEPRVPGADSGGGRAGRDR